MSATGFEPVTVCLEGRCSIQLSYAPILVKKSFLNQKAFFKSGWQDSNLRPPGPKPGAMTGLRYIPNIFKICEDFYKCRKKYKKIKALLDKAFVSATGFEPVTVCLEGRCSIQLSYAPILVKKSFLNQKAFFKSGWQDSNLRPPGPKPGAMTGLRYIPNIFYTAEGKGFEPLRPLRVDSLANCSVNHSGNPPYFFNDLLFCVCECKYRTDF